MSEVYDDVRSMVSVEHFFLEVMFSHIRVYPNRDSYYPPSPSHHQASQSCFQVPLLVKVHIYLSQATVALRPIVIDTLSSGFLYVTSVLI